MHNLLPKTEIKCSNPTNEIKNTYFSILFLDHLLLFSTKQLMKMTDYRMKIPKDFRKKINFSDLFYHKTKKSVLRSLFLVP